MSEFPCPDYEGGSLVNLTASLGAALGIAPDLYPPLPALPASDLRQARRIVLLIMDGLGYDYLERQPPDGALRRHLRGRLDSVFPTTTAAAITSLLTGVAPQQHAITGWFMWLREIGQLASILPFRSRGAGVDLAQAGFDVAPLLGAPPLFSRLAADSLILSPAWIVDSAFSRASGGTARRLGYRDLTDFFTLLADQVKSGSASYLYAYWPEFDSLAHTHGISSPRVQAHFLDFDKAFAGFLDAIAGTDTAVVLTADHGFIDTGPEQYVPLAEHPPLAACLDRPLCGEPRAAYCYLRPGRAAAFERYIQDQLSTFCSAVPSQDLVDAGYFGRGPAHPELRHRIGDYTLLMKDRFVIKDYVAGETPFYFAGVHSGLSEAELRVPLVVAEV